MEIVEKKDISDTSSVCTINLDRADIDKIYDVAIKKIQPQIKVKGFRANKVPKDIIEKRYSSYVKSELKDQIINYSFDFFAKSIKWLGKPELSKLDLSEDNSSAQVEFKYSPVPTMPNIDFSDTLISKPLMAEPTSADVSRFVNELLDSVVENYEKDNAVNANVDVDVGNENSELTFDGQVDVKKIRDSKGQDAMDRVSLLSDKEIEILFETSRDNLEEKIKTRLKEEFSTCSTNFIKVQLFNLLEDKLQFNLAPELLEKDLGNLSGLKDQLNLESKVFSSKAPEEQDKIIERYSSRRTKIGLFLSHYAEVNNIQITTKDLITALQQLQQADPMYYQYIVTDPQNRISEFKMQILEEKSVQHMLNLVNFDIVQTGFYDLLDKLEELENISFS